MYFEGSDVVTVGAASAQSAGAPAHIHKAMICSTTNCWVSYGENPTATTGDGSFYLPAGETLYFTVRPGGIFAVIQDSAGGSLSVSWLS